METFPLDAWSIRVDFDPTILEFDSGEFNPIYYSPTVANSESRVVVTSLGNTNSVGTSGGKEIYLGQVQLRIKASAPVQYSVDAISACAIELLGRYGTTLGKLVRFVVNDTSGQYNFGVSVSS